MLLNPTAIMAALLGALLILSSPAGGNVAHWPGASTVAHDFPR